MTPAGVLGALAVGTTASAALDADLRKALSKGDWKKAAKQLVNHLPIVGSAAQAKKAYEQGDYKIACLYGALAVMEGAAVVKAMKGVVQGVVSNIAKQGGGVKVDFKAPELGDKLKYVFGKATGTKDNIQRSTAMAKEVAEDIIFFQLKKKLLPLF